MLWCFDFISWYILYVVYVYLCFRFVLILLTTGRWYMMVTEFIQTQAPSARDRPIIACPCCRDCWLPATSIRLAAKVGSFFFSRMIVVIWPYFYDHVDDFLEIWVKQWPRVENWSGEATSTVVWATALRSSAAPIAAWNGEAPVGLKETITVLKVCDVLCQAHLYEARTVGLLGWNSDKEMMLKIPKDDNDHIVKGSLGI